MRHWVFDKNITKEIIVACSLAGISLARMEKGGLPSSTTIRQWRDVDRIFNGKLESAMDAQPNRKLNSNQNAKQYDWIKVRCLLLAGHSLSALHASAPDMPTRNEIASRAKQDPAWYLPIKGALAQRQKDLERNRAERKNKLLHRLRLGDTLAVILSSGAISRSLLDNWRASDRGFDAAIRAIVTARATEKKERRTAAAEAGRTRRLVRKEGARQRRLAEADAATDPVYSAADKAVPRTYPEDVRDDVISSIFLAVIEGEIDAREIPTKAKQFVSAYWRSRPEFHALSLDAPVGHSGGRLTLHDVIAQT